MGVTKEEIVAQQEAKLNVTLAEESQPFEGDIAIWLKKAVCRLLFKMDEMNCPERHLSEIGKLSDEEIGRSSNWIEGVLADGVRATTLKYKWGGENTERALEDLSSAILNIKLKGNEIFKLDVPTESYKIFTGAYEYLPTVGFFPFFMLGERKDSWEIIKYGELSEIALIMNESTFRTIRIDSIEPEFESFESTIKRLSQRHKIWFLYLGVGHAAYRIALQYFGSLSVVARFQSSLASVENLEASDRNAEKGNDSVEKIRKALKKKDNESDRYILISDLGDPVVKALKDEQDLKTVRLRLRTPIPVGVGLSLWMVPVLMKNSTLLNELINTISKKLAAWKENTDIVRAFEEDGIVLCDGIVPAKVIIQTPIPIKPTVEKNQQPKNEDSPSTPPASKRFAIAVSFPGEHRVFVAEVVSYLADELGRNKVFYDEWYESELVGAEADLKLQKVYRDQSELVVPFFSEHYEKKWCNLEWHSIRVILLEHRKKDIVVPVQMDETKIPGWEPIDFGIQVKNRSAQEIAKVILNAYRARNR